MIRLVCFTIAVCFGIIQADAQADVQKGVQFNKDFSDAFVRADKENKKVFMYFYADNCPACNHLQEEFANTSIGNLYNQSFVSYRFNASRGGKNAAEYYNIYSFPTMLFVADNGEPVYSLKGYREGKQIFDAGKVARMTGREIKKLMDKKFKDNPTDTDHLYDYIEYQTVKQNFSKANKLTKEYLELRDQIEEPIWMNFVLDNASDPTSPAHDLLIAEKERFYKKFSRKQVDPIIWTSILRRGQENGAFFQEDELERAFVNDAQTKGYKSNDPYMRQFFYNYLFSNPQLLQSNFSRRQIDIHTRYAYYALENREEFLGQDFADIETLLRTSIYLLRYEQKASTMGNLNDLLDSQFEQNPSHRILDMQANVLYALGNEELAIEKITEARELAAKTGIRDYKPSVTNLKKQRILK